MNIELNSVKLSKSKINQLQPATIEQMINYNVTGYVVDLIKGKLYRKVLLYSPTENHLCFAYYLKSIEVGLMDAKDNQATLYHITMVSDKGIITHPIGGSASKSELEVIVSKLETMMKNANEIGQIFF